MKNITVEQLVKGTCELKTGDKLLLSGPVYTARDAAHKKISELISHNQPLPFDLKDLVIYYCGPCPAKPGDVIGSCGPTTSSRMDQYTPLLLSKGVKGLIGKGPRSQRVKDALKTFNAYYFAATGGVAALISKTVRKAELVAFKELGPEAVYKLEVVDFPLIVANGPDGGDVYKSALSDKL
jgi:fumarate hydratase subunit beta